MFDFKDYVIGLLGVLTAIPAAYISAKKRVQDELHKRLAKISGGQISTIEDLVASALAGKRLREETKVNVYGSESLWADLRKGRFYGAQPVSADPQDSQPPSDAQVAVVDPDRIPEELIANLSQRYVLIYKEGPRYQGKLPPGAEITFANSSITLDARLMEALRHMEARR